MPRWPLPPPQPSQWKIQLASTNSNNERTSSFNFYRKDQRDKTIFFSVLNNGHDNRYQYRVQQISGGIILLPFNDDDRYQFDVGGTFDKIKDTTLINSTFFSRFTYRPNRELWMRLGFEYHDGYELDQGINPYVNSILNAYYLAVKYKIAYILICIPSTHYSNRRKKTKVRHGNRGYAYDSEPTETRVNPSSSKWHTEFF